jgi:hypothetical protein
MSEAEQIALWPLADRDQVVQAYRLGKVGSTEAPFRTLKGHRWVSGGVRVTSRARGVLAGQLTLFSSLNVDAARLARHGKKAAAMRIARAAEKLEQGLEFKQLIEAMAQLPRSHAEQIVRGEIPSDAPAHLLPALHELARRTELARHQEPSVAKVSSMFAGRISEVHEDHVLVRGERASTPVQRSVAKAAHREKVGDALALVTDLLEGARILVDAVPALGIPPSEADAKGFSPFGRSPAARAISASDRRVLEGKPAPLKILIPISIES